MTKTTPRREAVRAVLLNEHDEIMLLRYDEAGGFWATPGGRLEPGETDDTALTRELLEELGLHARPGPQLAVRVKEHPVGSQVVRQSERYYLVRVTAADVDESAATQPDNIRERRWWTASELASTTGTVYPAGLLQIVRPLINGTLPAAPVVLT